ncbi:MAG: MMPL family transporter [Planctomycetes bacterium]|nr:MMPL family transporter [Planctomycetota bacterium]
MGVGASIAEFSVKRPKLVTAIMAQLTIMLALLAALPSIWPETFKSLEPLKVDTDPENMLPADEDVRVFHDNMKKEMSLYDMVVVGIVNEKHPDGVFNPVSLAKIEELTKFAKGLRGEALFGEDLSADDPRRKQGVIEVDIIAPSTVDNIRQENGAPKYEWLMRPTPSTPEEARAVRSKAQRIPFLNGTLVSENGKAVCMYLPLTSKDLSYKVYSKLMQKISEFDGDEEFHVTGLPVAEDTFGVEMFKQMAMSAPIAMLVIFLLMLVFFRKIALIISPMIVAMVCVIATMSLLVITGNTIHIMSSMIPIFIMPIAVLDAVHILSDFFDRYQATKDRRATIISVMDTLFWPMLYTSLTTAVGFGSLALTPIPPVQIFGIFVALGVVLAWVWTITFIPAYIMFIKDKSLENFGTAHHAGEPEANSALARLLAWTGRATYNHAKLVMLGVAAVTIVAAYGMNRIRINDNPIKWFTKTHPIRHADAVLNRHFGGTYMGYLALEATLPDETPQQYAEGLARRLSDRARELEDAPKQREAMELLSLTAEQLSQAAESSGQVLSALEDLGITSQDSAAEAEDDQAYDAWDEALAFVALEQSLDQIFKRPDVLQFVADLQTFLPSIRRESDGAKLVGKSNSVADIVRTVRREFLSGDDSDYKIPATTNESAELLMNFQTSNRPRDLWHFVTPDYGKSVIWVQLKSGDNNDMARVVKAVDGYVQSAGQPPGVNLTHRWFGLTYINVIWQEKMVAGMLQAFLGSFLIVFLLMTLLYRSALWGLLSMVPLTVTIALIYGAIGLVGKDYDMPVAVLSSLSIGLAVDYAIHFLSRSREAYKRHNSWGEAVGSVFGEPARAIARNVVVVGVGFLPLLAASLMPYKTVGIFIAAILLVAGLASLLILPSLITLLERFLFPKTKKCCLICNCTTCIVSTVAVVAIVALNVHQFLEVGWTKTAWMSLIAVIVLAQVCFFVGRSKMCRMEVPLTDEGEEQ